MNKDESGVAMLSVLRRFPLPVQQVGNDDPGEQLPFIMEKQEQTSWCWAAVVASIHFFLDREKLTQCGLAGEGCCPTIKGRCNHTDSTSEVLKANGNLKGESIANFLEFDEVQEEIKAKRPIGCGLDLSGGSGHAAVIFGWDVRNGEKRVYVADPTTGSGPSSYETFVESSESAWERTYLTKKTGE